MVRQKSSALSHPTQRVRDEIAAAREHLLNAAEHGAHQVSDTSRRTRDEARDRARRAAQALRGERPSPSWQLLGIGLIAGVAGGVAAAIAVRRWRGPATEAVREKTAPAVEAVREKTAPAVEAVREKTGPAVEAVREKTAPAVEAVREKATAAAHRARDAVKGRGSDTDEPTTGDGAQSGKKGPDPANPSRPGAAAQ